MPTVPKLPLPKGDRWLSGREVATAMGLNRETIARWRRESKLTGYRVGKMFWYKRSEVNVILAANDLPTL